MKYVPNRPINNWADLVQVVAWCRAVAKALHATTLTVLLLVKSHKAPMSHMLVLGK